MNILAVDTAGKTAAVAVLRDDTLLYEAQCNNGLNCSDCRYEGKPVHDIHLCTGFVGDITQYIRNWMRHHGGKADT